MLLILSLSSGGWWDCFFPSINQAKMAITDENNPTLNKPTTFQGKPI